MATTYTLPKNCIPKIRRKHDFPLPNNILGNGILDFWRQQLYTPCVGCKNKLLHQKK